MAYSVDVRSETHSLISSITPFDGIEKEHLSFALEWIQSGAEIFRLAKPATPPIHLVAYFVVLSTERDQILLVDHKKSGLWLPPGGHVEQHENPKETVRREAKEELGVNAEFIFDIPLFLTVSKTVGNVETHTDVSLWYLLKGNPLQVLDYDKEEFNHIQWFQIHELPFRHSDPHLQRFIQKIITSHV